MISTQKRLLIAESISLLICGLCVYNFMVMSHIVKDFNASGKSIEEYDSQNNIEMAKVYQCYVIYFALFIFFALTFVFCVSQSLELRDDHLAVIFNNTSFTLFTIIFIIILALFLTSLKKYNTDFVYYTDVAIIVMLSLILTIFIYNLVKNKIKFRRGSTSSSYSYSSDDYSM